MLRFDPTGNADATLASLHDTIEKAPLKAVERERVYGLIKLICGVSVDCHQPRAGGYNGTLDVFVRDRLLNKSKRANMKLAVTDKPVSATRGTIASYTFTVSNNGPVSAGSVTLIDVISRGTAISLIPSQGTCKKAAVSVCRLGTLAAGASATVTVSIKAKGNPLTQQLTISAAPLDIVPANNRATVRTPATP